MKKRMSRKDMERTLYYVLGHLQTIYDDLSDMTKGGPESARFDILANAVGRTVRELGATRAFRPN